MTIEKQMFGKELMAEILVIMLLIPMVSTVYADNHYQPDQPKNAAQENARLYNEMIKKTYDMKVANHMNNLAEINLQKFIDAERTKNQELSKKYFNHTLEQQFNYTLAKPNLAKISIFKDVQKRDWYIIQTKMDNHDIFLVMQELKQQRINISDTGNLTMTNHSFNR